MGTLDKQYFIKLDTKLSTSNIVPQFFISDNETSDILIRITNENNLIDLTDVIVLMVAISPNNQPYSDFLEVKKAEEGLVYCDLKSQFKNIEGNWKARIMCIYQNEKLVTNTFSYKSNTDEFVTLNEEIVTDDRFPLFTDLISRLSQIEIQEETRINNENSRVEAEKQREIVKQQLIVDIQKLIADTNLKVETNLSEQNKKVDNSLLENSNKVTKLINDTNVKIDNYKTAKDLQIDQDLELYKNLKDIQINTDLESYKTSTTKNIEDYKVAKDTQINQSLSTYENTINTLKEDFNEAVSNVTNGNESATNTEIVLARKGEKSLRDKIDKIDEQYNTKASKDEVDIERKRIDSFTTLAAGSTTGDAELIDARIGADGVTYDNVGSANRTQFANLDDSILEKATFIDEEKSQVETYDCLSSATIKNYLSKTIGFTFDELIGSTITKISVSASNGNNVKFAIYSCARKYPDNPSNLTMIYTKLKDLGEALPVNNIATLEGLSVKLLENQVIMYSTELAKLGYQTSEGNSKDLYAYNKDGYITDVGGTFEGTFTTNISANRGAYSIEYITPSKISRKNVSDAFKEIINDVREIPTIKQDILNCSNGILEINNKLKNINTDSDLKELFNLRKPINKYFVLLVDDLTRDVFKITSTLIENNIYPAFGIRMDTVGSQITWDEIRELQNMGFEMAFHGMTHADFPAGSSPTKDDVMSTQIQQFKTLCEENNVYIKGYLGPNHYQLPVSCRREFEWARSAYGLKAYGGGGSSYMTDTFANLIVMSTEITSSTQDLTTFKTWSESVGNNQYLTPMCHTQNLVAQITQYLEVFNKWKADGLVCIRPCDAVRQSFWDSGSIGQNSTFEIQAGIATSNYFVVAKNGNIKTNQFTV